MIFQQLINGLTMGSIYSLLAVGVTIIYKTLGMLNFAHGDMIMVSAFIALMLYGAGLPLWLAILLTVALTMALGLLLERFIYRRLQFGTFTNLLIATVGVSYIIRNLSLYIWGAEAHVFPDIFTTDSVTLGEFVLIPQNLFIVGIAIGFVIVLQLFFYRTRSGKRMRIAASDAEAAALMGVNVPRTRFLIFGISSAFAAVAGILISPMYYVSTNLGTMVGLKAFTAAILGGFGNIYGALVGGLLLGLIEALGSAYISTAYRDVITFLVLFLVLYIKPTGLFVKKVDEKL